MIKINFLLFLPFFYLACSGQNLPECKGFTQKKEISLGRTMVKYMLDSNFVYKYEFFEKAGPIDSKKYGLEKDTLILRWYYNERIFNDSIAQETIKNWLNNEGVSTPSYSFRHLEFSGLDGVLSEVKKKNSSKMIYFGINRSTNKLLLAEYDLVNNRDNFFCVLNSMTFRDSSEPLHKE